MLGKIDLTCKLDKKQYKSELAGLEKTLAELQRRIKEQGIPVIIALEGFSAAGKGNLISKIVYPLDPREFNVYTMDKVSEDAYMRPFLWSFWTKIPSKGRITIFDKTWHKAALPSASNSWHLGSKATNKAFYDINAFERQLNDDGTLIIKLFLHISQEEQKRRLKEIERNPDTSWRVSEKNWEQNKNYDRYVSLFENMIQQTNSGDSQWSVIEADDVKYATIKAYKIIISKIETELNLRQLKNSIKISEPTTVSAPEISILSSVDLSKDISDKVYKEKLQVYQSKISDLGYKLYTKRKSVVIVYEGWDASGKGGNIKRLTEELDPRGYEVVPVAKPTEEELSHHYLWRFFNKLPKDGHIAIFDRSWYGRVLVERIEGFCDTKSWQNAYKEINDMEMHLANHGTVIFKFWFHIDKQTQLERFKAREINPLKSYKITDEDWRNREKWDLYEKAVNEMLFRTNTEYAPWTIIESNSKKFARIKVLKHVVKLLQEQLK